MPGPGRGPRPPWPVAGESICATCPAVSCRVSTTSNPNLRLSTTHNQPTYQPAPSVLLRLLQPATVCFICKMTSIKLTTKLKFPCITNETDVQVFSVGSWNSNGNNHKFPWQGVLYITLTIPTKWKGHRFTDFGTKGLFRKYLFWNNCRESQHFWHTRWSSNNPLKVCRLKSNNRFQIDLCRRWCAAQNMENI